MIQKIGRGFMKRVVQDGFFVTVLNCAQMLMNGIINLLYNFLYFFTITILIIKHLKSGGDKTLPLTNTAYYNSFGLICLILTFGIPYDCINF